MAKLLEGRFAIVLGIANKWSLAYAIAQAFSREGATLALTYLGERQKGSIEDLSNELNVAAILPCDVTKDDDIASVFKSAGGKFGRLHLLLHSVAFAPKAALEGEFLNTDREAFRIAHDVSVYSLIAVARGATPLMEEGGSIMTMTYYGAEKVVPRYNVMGVAKAALECSVRYLASDLGAKNIRVNAISAGPIKTLAARGIAGFGDMLKGQAERAPLRRNVETAEDGAGEDEPPPPPPQAKSPRVIPRTSRPSSGPRSKTLERIM